jgi:hypothetical protein
LVKTGKISRQCFFPEKFFSFLNKIFGKKWIFFFGPVQIQLIFLIFGEKIAKIFRSYYTRGKPQIH